MCFPSTFVWYSAKHVTLHTHKAWIVSMGPSHDRRAAFLFVFSPAGASHQPQLDLSSAVKSPFKTVLLCPLSPTSCGWLKFSLISQRDFSSLVSFSPFTVLHHNFNILPTPFALFQRNLRRRSIVEYSVLWIQTESFYCLSTSDLCSCVPPGVGHQ